MELKNYFLTLFFLTLFSCAHTRCMQIQKINLKNLNTLQTFIFNLVLHNFKTEKAYIQQKDSLDKKVAGNAAWDFFATSKTPVSVKLATKEQSIKKIFKKTPNSKTIMHILKNSTSNTKLEQTILEFIYDYYNINNWDTSKWNAYQWHFLFGEQYQIEASVFLLDQFPELRKKILHDNTYQNQDFRTFIKKLRKKRFSCRPKTTLQRTVNSVQLEPQALKILITPKKSLLTPFSEDLFWKHEDPEIQKNELSWYQRNKKILGAATITTACVIGSALILKKINNN